MNLLDLIVLLLGAGAVAGGYAVGLIARVSSWVGLVAGFGVALALVPSVTDVLSGASSVALLLITVGALLAGASLGSGVGETVGRRLRMAVPQGPARSVDRAGGGVAGGVGVLVGLWLLLPVLAEVPGLVSRQARTSAIADFLTSVAQPPRGPTAEVRALVNKTDFPQVFADLRASPDTGDPPASMPIPSAVVARATASTVNVESVACGALHEGSGFAVSPDLVMTNAHVVAGSRTVVVRRPDGRRLSGEVTAFAAGIDLALVRVPGLNQTPLTITNAETGTPGAIIGHPGGQNAPRPTPAIVRSQRTTVGRDIYGHNRVRREVLFLAARVAPGDSGGPMVDAQGRVVGVAFAAAPDRSAAAYALPDEEINKVLRGPRGQGSGPCLA